MDWSTENSINKFSIVFICILYVNLFVCLSVRYNYSETAKQGFGDGFRLKKLQNLPTICEKIKTLDLKGIYTRFEVEHMSYK